MWIQVYKCVCVCVAFFGGFCFCACSFVSDNKKQTCLPSRKKNECQTISQESESIVGTLGLSNWDSSFWKSFIQSMALLK